MPKTISFHTGAVWSRGHNIRDERYTGKQEHIDSSLSANNVIICDIPVRQAYEDIFGQAVKEYNDRQKRADRKIDSYYDKIKQDKRKHPVYECIVQIGDKDDTGNSAESERQALIRFAEEWEQRNPNLRLIGAYLHADEPNGTVHLHCDFIPVAECLRGMTLQNSYDKALQQQGFKSENIHQTAQIAWQTREREALTAICRDLNIDAQHSQGIGKGRKYLSPQEYKRAKDKMSEQIDEELQPLKAELDEYRELDVSAKAFIVEKKKVPLSFGKKVTVATEDMERLEEQAKAYRVNRSEVDTLRKRKTELDERSQWLDDREQQLDERQAQLDKDRATVQQNHKTVKQMYERQRGVNQLLEQAESKVSSQSAEIGSLRHKVEEQDKTIQELRKRLETSQETVRGAYESLTNVVKAVGMLKYDKEDGYAVNLNTQQSRLIDAIEKYGARWARTDGQPDLAEKMEKTIGISNGIQEDIDELTPKRSRGRGGMSL